MQKRGQAATEFLTTYGWAILVVLIVTVAIVFLGIFNPQTPTQCKIDLPFTCQDIAFREGGFEIKVGVQKILAGNVIYNEVKVNNEICTNLSVFGNAFGDLSLKNGINKIRCYDYVNKIKEGKKVIAEVGINYTSESNLDHRIKGYISGEVEKSDSINNFDNSAALSFNFDNDNSTTAIDNSYYVNNGILNGVTPGGSCIFGKCYNFDGISNTINILTQNIYTTSLNLNTSSFTIEAWVNANAPYPANGYYVYEGLSNKPVLQLTNSGDLRLILTNAADTSTDVYTTAGGLVTGNNWHHVASTYDGSNVRLYVDGNLLLTTPRTGPFGGVASQYLVGGKSTVFFNGQIDNLRVYRRALTSQEITAHSKK